MNRAQKRHLCFYSNTDKWSKAFIEELSKVQPWFQEFEFICVDRDPSRPPPNLPKWLKQVPTLVINGDQEPIKTDTEVMNWLYERKMKEMPAQKPKAQGQNTQAILNQEPAAWVGSEMGGMGSATYSYIDSDTSSNGNGGADFPGTFTFLNGQSSPGDRQSDVTLSQSLSTQGTRSKKEMMFDKQLDQYKQQRDFGMPQGPARQ